MLLVLPWVRRTETDPSGRPLPVKLLGPHNAPRGQQRFWCEVHKWCHMYWTSIAGLGPIDATTAIVRAVCLPNGTNSIFKLAPRKPCERLGADSLIYDWPPSLQTHRPQPTDTIRLASDHLAAPPPLHSYSPSFQSGSGGRGCVSAYGGVSAGARPDGQ